MILGKGIIGIIREALVEFNYMLEIVFSQGKMDELSDCRICHWTKPPKDCFKVNVDGS